MNYKKLPLIGFFVVAAFIAILPNCASANQLLFVNQNAPAGSQQTGASWANAITELRTALPIANQLAATTGGAEIWVAGGTYYPTAPGSGDRQATFNIGSRVTIRGGFLGGKISPDQRTNSFNVFGQPNVLTVLSGDIGYPMTNHLSATNTLSDFLLNTDAPPPPSARVSA